jgi:hypothetical protein
MHSSVRSYTCLGVVFEVLLLVLNLGLFLDVVISIFIFFDFWLVMLFPFSLFLMASHCCVESSPMSFGSKIFLFQITLFWLLFSFWPFE